MMKAVLLESKLYANAMAYLTELKESIEYERVDFDEIIESIEFILNLYYTAEDIAGRNTIEEGTQFEIVNNDADPKTYMGVKLITESES